ncbi:SDR family NAD(P)-dependent oxidoreductase [Enterovibrio calviensis]|uniref:SDR family NAD(P)-dependent oxidoreductase n=1 Tax=Enterovibrio calviensis TaxID=91359 RepID=UPI0037353D8D
METNTAKRNTKPVVVIVGFGKGLGRAIASRFEKVGYVSVGISRTSPMISADTTIPAEVNKAFAKIEEQFGTPDTVICNTAMLTMGPFLSTPSGVFEQTWRTAVMSTFNVASAVLPRMVRAKHGTLIVTGATASIKGGKNFSAFSSAKFALRGLTQSLAREFQPQGVHVAHVLIDGIVWSEKSRERFPELQEENAISPSGAANLYFTLATQPKSAWSHELDLRPYSENF